MKDQRTEKRERVHTRVDALFATRDPFIIRTLKYQIQLCETFDRLDRQGYPVRFWGNGLHGRLVIAGGKRLRKEG